MPVSSVHVSRSVTVLFLCAAGKDFVFSSTELTFGAGEMEQLLSVPIIDDEIFEATEFFQLEVSVKEEFVAWNVSTGTPSITTVMIMDLDSKLG